MKKIEILIPLVFLICLVSCDYFNKKDKTPEPPASGNLPYTKDFPTIPDSTINSTNAYNELFLNTAYLDEFIKNNKLTFADSAAIKGFYNLRNFEYTWFANDGLTEQGRAFWSAYTYAKAHEQKDTINDKALVARMDKILNTDTLAIMPGDSSFLKTEVALTQRFIHFYNRSDRFSLIHQIPITQLLPVRKTDPVVMADSILNYSVNASGSDTSGNPFFKLKQQLALYTSIAKKGGWQPISTGVAMLKKGTRTQIVTDVKKRLLITAELGGTDSSSIFTDSFEAAIKSFQVRNGFEPDGFITDSVINILNIPVEQRIRQILINMNRMAWLPQQIGEKFVAVNIPDFMLEVYEADSVPIKMEVIVGKEGSGTMMFAGDLNQVVFSPVWHVPASIVKNEILPQMKIDPGYLKSKNMLIVRQNDSLPEIDQLPGPGNAMGKVKFLFPNSYDIYLHDTEAKELFSTNKRAFSHGCIRLADAEKMSEYVLKNNANWTRQKIQQAMNGSKEQSVAVKDPIPVLITYFTAWVDADGAINFREDIYQHDLRTGNRMFNAA